ncbi:sulfotransferase domain-containing protein [Candidatus Pelagibacter sp.]|nr:sulfotransferase domain-containing protein [Candidatus Pelagibacter sp.]|tara:strand:- start:1113 stop:1976 length:864 start_codon:yes stop_codon:yes gene_type:complete
MIIWLASYPKSGNTLLRSMISAYFFTKDGNFDFKILNNINQFPDFTLFKNYGVNTSDQIEIVKNYVNVQKQINTKIKNSIKFIKTHSALRSINGYPFTDLNNSLGVIYIVRDPRSVAKSYANHNQMSLERASDRMLEDNATLGGLKNPINEADKIITHMGSWPSNYESWKDFKKSDRYLLVKYEDIIKDKENIFLNILRFIHKLANLKFSIDNKKLKNIMETTSFENMQKLEKNFGFEESVKIKKDSKKNTFFKYGPKVNTPESLPPEVKKKLEVSFKNEMKELGYS